MPIILLMKAIPAGARWVTIKPNGPDAKGQPILIQPQPDGSAKVIGGAGGKLNHLRLTGVRKEGEYADTLKERAGRRREADKAQRKRDKEAGIYTAKVVAQQRIKEQVRKAQRDYVAAVADTMGWDKADLAFDASAHEDKTDEALARLRLGHHAEMVKRADEAVRLNRERLLADAAAQAETSIGEVPLNSDDATVLSVQDLDPVRPSAGLGFATNYSARAEDNGAEVKTEAAAFKKPLSDAARKAAIENGEMARLVRDNLALMRDGDQSEKLAPKLVEAKQALSLMKLEKMRRMAERQARDANKAMKTSEVAPKAFVIEVDDAEVDAKVAEDVANDLRTISTRAFLAEVAKTAPDPVKALSRHIGSGAYNSVNALALAAGGAALVDRSVVDVLGIAGGAAVLARRLQKDLTPDEFKAVAEGMQDFHLNHYVDASAEAITRARELADQAAEIELGAVEAENGDDLAAMRELNRRRVQAISESHKVLGTALGEMEANAALVYALGRGSSDKPFQVSLGDTSTDSAVAQVRALGLRRGEYTLESAGGNRILQVTPEGMDRLAAPVSREDLEQVRRNLDIISGAYDQDDWLPEGFIDRADLAMAIKPGSAPQLAEPFEPGDDLESAVSDYIGGRAADGDSPGAIIADLQSADFFRKVGAGRAAEYRAVLDRVAPLADADGKMRQTEALRGDFEALADKFVMDRHGAERMPLHRQTFDLDDKAADALHRALAAEPAGVAAYKPIGEMTPQDQAALREHFAKHVAKESADTTALRADLDRIRTQEPEREVEDMFGDKGVNPDWSAWKQQRDDLAAKVNASGMTWPKYVEAMRGPERAYAAMQDVVRSTVSKSFVESYNTLNPGSPLKLGRAAIRDNLNHLDAVDPVARDARLAKERALTDQLRNRTAGRYSSGSVRDKLDDARSEQAGFDAAQMGFFAADPEDLADRPLDADERWTVGHEAERRIAQMMPAVGANFRPGQPVKLFRPSMSGEKEAPRQRAIKLLDANKRTVLSFGTGSGKTAIGLGAFTHLHSQGKVKRGLFLVPSIAQGGFHGEALRFLQPGKYQWHAKPGADRAERIAAYKDPANHFAVMTHQSFRDDMVHLGATQAGVDEQEMAARVGEMPRAERQAWLKGVMRSEGIAFDYLNVDEGHDTLNRRGKENSTLSNVVDALSDSAPYYLNASADPIKNDVSEAFSLLQKMDPGRYTDQAAFMRRYGVDTIAAKEGLRRELARFQYPSKIDPDITATRSERSVAIAPGQQKALDALDGHVAAARIARIQGRVDVEAIKAISPSSFEGVPPDQHEELARDLTQNLGILKQTALRKVLDAHPESGKVDEVLKVAGENRGKQGVVFAHSLDAVEALRARLTREGYRVGLITGKDSAKEKARRIAEFKPQGGGPAETDIIVASDAGATGANLQSGQWLVNFDTPQTAKTHAQRNGRINRIGQTNNVDLIDLVSDHPEERRARDRLTRKYALRDMMTTPMEGLDDTGVAHFIRQRRIAQEQGASA